MIRVTGDFKKDARIAQMIRDTEELLVKKGQLLADKLKSHLGEKIASQNKERQLRNIQAMAEKSPHWALVELFMRYQAARGEIGIGWAEEAIKMLDDLKELAKDRFGVARQDEIDRVHIELVRRTLGYAVRWHVWHAKGETQLGGSKR